MNQWLKTGSLRGKCLDTQTLSSSSQTVKSTSSRQKKRKYDEDYLKNGFTCKEESQYPEPQCVICSEVLANSSMKPLLRRHLKTKHQQYVDKPLEFFVGKKRELGPSKKKLTNTVPTKSEYIFTGLFSCGIQNSADRRIIQYC
jgi:hypothetical protein